MRLLTGVLAASLALVALAGPPSTRSGRGAFQKCPWAKFDPNADEETKEELVEEATKMRASPLFQQKPGSDIAAVANLQGRFDPTKITSGQELAKYFDGFMKARGWSEELRTTILKLPMKSAVDLMTRFDGNVVAMFDAANAKYGKDFGTYLDECLADPARRFSLGTHLLSTAAVETYPFPVAELGRVDLGGGLHGYHNISGDSGGSTYVYKGTLNGKEVAIKVQKIQREDGEVDQDLKVLESLAPYGAPKSYGIVRVKDESGQWRPALALELVKGQDLLKLRVAMEEKKPLSVPVTAKHVAAFEAFVARIEREDTILDDVQPGDFMLTPDGRMVPLDMRVRKAPKSADGTRHREVVATLKFLNEHLATLRALQNYKPPAP